MNKPNYIYAISDGTAIKIGVSNNPQKRIKTLSTGNSNVLILLGYFEGSFDEEKRIHKNFRKIRENGEWLYATEELINFLNDKFINSFVTLNKGQLLTHTKITML